MNMTKKKIAFLSISVAFLITLLGGALFGQASSKTSIYRPLSIFTEVFDLVRSNYVESVTSDQLLDGAFSGVTDAIDEFSYYVPPSQMAAYKGFTDTDDNGTGLIVSRRFGYAYVISSVPGSPAAKAGVERGDFIDKIDGKPTTKMAVWQMKGALAAAHPVELSVLHAGQTKREPFKLEHANFHPVNVATKQYGNVAVITIPYFDKGTEAQFRTALDSVHKAGTRKLIVDVRGNAAGDIDEAIASADDLLTSGLITSLDGRKIEMKKWQADRNTAYDGDVEVLTDASTAGGGEIFAAAIHGNSRGKTVGVTTYGKSIVQKFIALPSGGGVYMTVAHYTTPDLKPIKDGGVKPDVLVDLSAQAIREPNDKSTPAEPREDLIMEKALSLYGENMTVAPKKAA
jgi:carboxyl-terminal processing protease